jgi:hypothetical protein
MRFVFLSGGVLGFAVAATASWLNDSGPSRLLLNSAVGCLAGGLLFRWFWTVLLRGLRETILIRQKAAAAALSAGKQH